MSLARRVLSESAAAAVFGYIAAAALEAALIRALQPTEWELAWVGDAALAIALGSVVYLWRHLLTTRRELEERERSELVLETQLSLAAEIQQRLLPKVPPTGHGFEWAAALRSAGKIGGDFYDFVEISPSLWVILVADVSGKGIPAAMALGSLRSAFHTLSRDGSSPAEIVRQLSRVFYEQWLGGLYVTCIVATFDLASRTLTYTNAGHPPGILAGPDSIRHLDRGGPPAGLFPEAEFDQELVQLRAGEACLLVTDGVTEALEGQRPLADDLEAALDCRGAPSAAELCQAMMARALLGHGPVGTEGWDDDRTVVVVKVCESVATETEGLTAAGGERELSQQAALS